MKKTAVLAFSGGLDTSYCVPALMEQGYDVVTLFVDTGGAGAADLQRIEDRAKSLGASEHLVEDASTDLWESFVVPFVMGGSLYQDQYPVLCSDRYVIARRLASVASQIGASAVAHGCTAMGNDQVRIDHSLRCLTSLPILAPIRDLQSRTATPRMHEIEYLQARGFAVDETVRRYTINENVLGATISGAEIDQFDPPSAQTHRMTAARADWPDEAVRVSIGFEAGRAVSFNGVPMPGPLLLQRFNALFGAYGVGRGMYTGDTVIGLKGRIVFEAPGLTALLTAHRALEECVLSSRQNAFKPGAAREWTRLVYSGLFFEPLREDLEALIRSSQRNVTGEVEIETTGGVCHAVGVRSNRMLVRSGATYAQSADWTREDAEGFIKLYGMSSAIAADVERLGAPAAHEAALA